MMMLRRAFTVAAIVGAAAVASVVAEDEDFGPLVETPTYGNGLDNSFGNSSDGNNTNTNTTTTATTTTTTETTMPEMPHVHLTYFVSRLNQTDAEGNNPHMENLDCNLARVGQGAYFLNLKNTGGFCTEMPAIEGVTPSYYMLDMAGKDAITGVNNITTLNAFCPDENCSPETCKISRSPRLNPDTGIPEERVSPLAYDHCEPTNGNESFSFFVRQGHGANMVHDVCLLKNTIADVTFGVTELRYPKKSMCDDHEVGAIVASSLRSISNDDCDLNHFDGRYYNLRLIGQHVGGLVGCDRSCEPDTCQRYDGIWGQCSGHGEESTQSSHFKFYETRANGMTVKDEDPEHHKGIPLCGGMAPTPTPRQPNTPTVAPTSDPSKKKKEKEKYKMPAVILSALIGAFIVSYMIFWVLRRRKLRRMSAYAALQDDPTF